MKLLRTFTHPDFPTAGIETGTRKAVRVVLVDDRDMVLLIYSSKMNVYKIAGGEMESWEDTLIAAKRESTKELWCDVTILGEIWEIVEKRPADNESKRGNTVQSSYCYYGKVLSKWEVQMSENKIARGFAFVWLHVWEVLEKMKNSEPTTHKATLIKERDTLIFEEYLHLINKAQWNS